MAGQRKVTKNPYIAGLVAGGVAAILYLSLATGSAIGLLLFYLAPLPGFIAGFGWGVRAAVIAAAAGTLVIIASLGLTPALAYGVSLAIPLVIITHYAFLYRNMDGGDDQETASEASIEWYPVGHLVLIVALYGGVLAMLAVLLLGPSHEAYLAKIGSEIDQILAKATEAGLFKKVKPGQLEQYKHVIQSILPASTAVLWSLFAILNMWIAAHIVRLSDLMPRPWPDFARIEYPQILSFGAIALIALSVLLPGAAGLIVSGYAGALALAFLLLGLAVIHYMTRPFPARGLILFGTYVAVIFIGWGAIVLIILGIVEPLAQLRKRMKSAPS